MARTIAPSRHECARLRCGTIDHVSPEGAASGPLSEAINRHMTLGGYVPEVRVTEDMLTFTCLQCGRALRATQTVLTRTSGEVKYSCPHDDATLVTIHDRDYLFSEGDVMISVGAEHVQWWDFVKRRRPDPDIPPDRQIIRASVEWVIRLDEDHDENTTPDHD